MKTEFKLIYRNGNKLIETITTGSFRQCAAKRAAIRYEPQYAYGSLIIRPNGR